MANLFDQFDADAGAQPLGASPAPPAAQPAATPNLFDQFDEDLKPENQVSTSGSLLHHFERGIVPSASGLAVMGTGMEVGGAAGLAVGGPIGGLVGGVVGGAAAAIGGSTLIGKAQDWALHQLPDSWVEKLGQDDRTQQLEEEYHPTASFIGGYAPYLLTMKPSFKMMSAALPENATAWQKILANPVTARIFGGATMGGMEAAQEVAAGEKPDWRNVAIATGFGMVFNRPTRLGEAITELGARPGRAITGAPEPVAAPTIAQAGDAKVMGPGITEEVFRGSHEQAAEAAMTSQETARTETSLLGPPPEPPDVHTVARRIAPDAFGQYEALLAQRDDLSAHLAAVGETPEAVQIRQRLTATDAALRDMAPEIASAYRRAADAVGAQTVEPETTPAAEAAPAVAAKATGSPEIQAQVAAIAQNVAAELVAAGRPAEEARAAGELIAQHYRTRAARMDNAIGGPQAIYESEGPTIRRGGAAPKAAIAGMPKPVIDPVAAKAAADTQGVTNLVTKMIGAGASDEEISALVGKKLSVDQVAALRPTVSEPTIAELAQSTTLEQSKRGAITFAEGQRPIIKLFADANASTFIHETGHQWLEELMRDAVHPAASDSVRTDAQTVKTWLGMEGDTIATKQHEKFARGFEQYMREGVAPSQGLARVFAQFKTWLTQIYQTIKGLGNPISDDIRQVFDRMLAEEPQRTILAPERPGQPSLATIHETDAAEARPSEAAAIGDRIASERDREVAEQPPEIQNEIARASTEGTEPGGEAGAGEAGQREVVNGGGEPEPLAPGGGGSGERGPVVESGNAGMAEGAAAPAGAEPAGGPTPAAGLRGQRPSATGDAQPLAPKPANLFGRQESRLVDKAGNIRLDNLTSDTDVAQAIRDSARENNDFIGDRRGVVTDGQVLDLADALGMDAAQLSTRKLGQAFNAEQIVAARKLLIQSATDVSELMKQAAEGTDQDVMAYAQAKARHQMIQAQVSGITAEAGRALRAFRSLIGQEKAQNVDQFLRNSTAKTLFQLKAEAKLGARLDTPESVSKFVNDAQKRGFWDMALEYWINGLISGPSTHATYSIGNTILALEKAGPETAAAAMIGAVRRAAGRPGEVVHLGEVRAQLAAAARSIPAAAKAAADAFRTGVTTRLPGETARSLPFQPATQSAPGATLDETVRYSDVGPAVFGLVRGLRDGLVSIGTLVDANAPPIGFRYSPLGAIPDIAVRGVPVLPLGTAARIPSRFIASIHSFFRAMNYSMAKNGMAYRTAAEEGLEGNAFDARVADVRQNPTEQIMDAARESATQLTLMGKGSEFVQALSRLTNKRILGVPILKFIDPFVHIGGNIIDQSIVQRTPVGLLSQSIRDDMMGKNGNIAQDTAMARMLVGTGMSIAFGSLAAEGLVSGSGPKDPDHAAMWRMAVAQPHSIRIGDMWYTMNRLGPMGMLASISADMYDVAHMATAGDLQLAGSTLMHAFTQNILDESFMSGPAQFIQAVEDPGRYGQAYIRNFISSFIPYSVGVAQVNRAMDPYSRKARTVMDAVRAKVPGLSETLMPRRDIWGEPIPNMRGVGGLTAIYAQQANADPVNQAMLNLNIAPAPVDPKIRNVQLTAQQYDDYARLAGRMAKQRLNVIVRSPDWQSWTPTVRHDVILEAIRQSRESARGVVMAKYPTIIAQATQAKLHPLWAQAAH